MPGVERGVMMRYGYSLKIDFVSQPIYVMFGLLEAIKDSRPGLLFKLDARKTPRVPVRGHEACHL